MGKNSKSVWYRYTPTTAGTVIANTVGSTYDTVLSVYTGSCGSLVEIACDDVSGAFGTSRIEFPASPGTTYLFEVTAAGSGAAGGTLELLVVKAAPAPTPTPDGGGGGGSPDDEAKPGDRCQGEIQKAGAKFLGKKLKGLAKCNDQILKCVQTKAEADGTKRADCVTKASTTCEKELDKIGREAAKLEASVRKRCDGPVSVSHLLDASGLGFGALAAECGGALATAADVAACLLAQHSCHAERLIEAAAPRAAELLRVAGVSLGTLECLTDHGGAGEDVNDEKGDGKLLERCAKAAERAAARFATKELKSLAKCLDKLYGCVALKPGDARCLAKADATCDKERARIGAEEAKLRAALVKRCAGLDWTTRLAAAPGLGLGTLTDLCAAHGVTPLADLDAYAECLARQHSCAVEALLRIETPRVDELLGLQSPPETLASPFCPAP